MSFYALEKVNPFYNDAKYTIQDWELEKYKKSDEILNNTSSTQTSLNQKEKENGIYFGCVA